MHKIELLVDKIIPYTLLLLLVIIILEIFYEEQIQPYTSLVEIADFFIISVFIVDLYFKFIRAKSIPSFLKSSWIEIIAVFPVFLVIRIFELFATISRIDIISQSTHGILEAGARWTKVIQEVERTGETTRFSIAHKFVRPLARIPRFAKAFVFFEKPTIHHRK